MPEKRTARTPRRLSPSMEDLTFPRMVITPPAGYSAIPTSSLTLFCGHGQVENQNVLVPYINMRLLKAANIEAEDAEDVATEELTQVVLPYENVAYLLMDLARDFRQETRKLRSFSSGDLKPEIQRLLYAEGCLASAQTAIQNALADLQSLTEPPPEPEAPQPVRPPVIRKARARKTS